MVHGKSMKDFQFRRYNISTEFKFEHIVRSCSSFIQVLMLRLALFSNLC